MRLLARAWLVASAAACASGCGDSTLWVVNGLDVPVQVTVSGQPPLQVDSGARRWIQLRPGTHPVEAVTLDGKGREAVEIELPRWGGAAVYSVAGAAPLYTVTAVYSNGDDGGGRNSHEILCGVRTFQRKIDYYFAEPPDTVTVSSGDSAPIRTSLLLGDGGWQTCLFMLQAEGKDLAAANMLPAVRAMHPSEEAVFAEARLRWIVGDEQSALALYRGAATTGGSRDAHIFYQRFGIVTGRREELLREYQAPSDRAPPAERRYLLARLLPAAEAVKELRALLAERPQDDEVRLVLAWMLNGAGRFAEALAALEPLGDGAALSADDRARLLRRRVWALVALGRPEQAVQAIRAESARPEPVEVWFLGLQGLLAARMGRPDLEPDPKAIEVESAIEQEWRQVTYDGLVHPERLDRARIDGLKYAKKLAPLMVKGAADPRSALASLHRFSSYDAQLLPESLAMVLWAEACRTGDSLAEKLLRHALLAESVDLSALCAYVTEGRPAMELADGWENRGAIHLARARALRAKGDAAGAAAEETLVRRYDVYGGPASRALESWPSTAPGAEQGTTRLASAQGSGKTREPRAPQAAPPPSPKPVEHRLILEEGVTLQPGP